MRECYSTHSLLHGSKILYFQRMPKKLSEQPVPSTARKEKKKNLQLGSVLKAI